ncbi:hypothetical protein MRX96_033420 [Rhipicephalus microplus]
MSDYVCSNKPHKPHFSIYRTSISGECTRKPRACPRTGRRLGGFARRASRASRRRGAEKRSSSTPFPKLAALQRSAVIAVNESYVDSGVEVTLRQGDEVAFIPPISGG